MSNVNEQNSNVNEQNQYFLEYKKKRTRQKPNRLYVDYNLSDEDRQSDLYKDYIAIKDKHIQDRRRSYLIAQEKICENNNMVFPEWAQKELEHLRKIKNNNDSRYRRSNWAYMQSKNIQHCNAYKNLIQDVQDNNVEDDGIERLKRYEEEIKLCQQLHAENQEAKKDNKNKQKKIVSQEEYEQYLLAKKQEVKKKCNELKKEKGLYPTNKFLTMPKKIKEPINVSNTIIDLDEDKMEQNQINK